MWQAVELREVRAFLTVAEELHFGRSAERLGVSQSRVSQTVRQLETKLGTPLFHRTSRRVELTRSGARLMAAVREPHEQLAGVLRAAADHPARGRAASRADDRDVRGPPSRVPRRGERCRRLDRLARTAPA